MKAIWSTFRDLKDKVFGELTAREYIGLNRWGTAIWRCSCSCGAEKDVLSSNLLYGGTVSCGHVRRENRHLRCGKKSSAYRHGLRMKGTDDHAYEAWKWQKTTAEAKEKHNEALRRSRALARRKAACMQNQGPSQIGSSSRWMGKGSMARRRNPKPNFPCRELTCERLSISRGLCAKHYWQAKRGIKLSLKYCATEEPQFVPWLKVPAPIPPPVPNRFGLELPARQKWEFDGDEQSLIEAAEKTTLDSPSSQETRP